MTPEEIKEMIRDANQVGVSAGQIALGEYILNTYADSIDLKLKLFLEKITSDEYEKVSKLVDLPAEDVALQVAQFFPK